MLCTTRTTYNKFHLLAEKQVTRDGTRTTTTLVYNELPGKLFPDQPANLHLPKQITVRYELLAGGAPRVEVQAFETDDYGNSLSLTEPSGKRTEYSYYPITGETNKCPADPHGLFQRYMKQERLVPAGGTPAARLTEYTHIRVPSTGARYFVVQQSIAQGVAFSQQHTYYDAPTELAGRLKTCTCTIDGQSLLSEFGYIVTGDVLTETRKLVGREGQSLESGRTLSLVFILLPRTPHTTTGSWALGQALLLVAGMLALVYSIKAAASATQPLAMALAVAVLGVGLLTVFVRLQLRSTTPMLDLSLFSHPAILAGMIMATVAIGALAGVELTLAQELQYVLGRTPLQAGVFMIPIMAAAAVGGPIAGYLSSLCGLRVVASASLVVSSVALAFLAFADFNAPGFMVPAMLALLGLTLSIGASSAPKPADGKVEMMVSGWMAFSYSTPSTM